MTRFVLDRLLITIRMRHQASLWETFFPRRWRGLALIVELLQFAFKFFTFSVAQYSIEPLTLRPPTAVRGRQIHIAALPNVLRNALALVSARWPCEDLVVSVAFARPLPRRPAAHFR